MKAALLAYVIVGFAIALWIYGSGVVEDIKNGPDHKFGYAYKSRVVWAACGLVGLPVVNLVFVAYLAYEFINSRTANFSKNT